MDSTAAAWSSATTRAYASEDFAAAVAEVAAAQGIKVALADALCPTPVVSFSIIDRKAGGGVVITASHNPWRWNGFKYKPDYGGSASPEIVAEIEEPLPDLIGYDVPRMDIDDAKKAGLVETFDARTPYLAHLGRLVDLDRLKAAGLNVAYDAMYGTGAGYFGALLGGGKTKLTELHGFRNPVFPGMHAPEPIARNLDDLTSLLVKGGARRRHRHRRRRRPRRHRRRARQLRQPAPGVRAARVLLARGARRARRHRQVGNDDEHGAAPRRSCTACPCTRRRSASSSSARR